MYVVNSICNRTDTFSSSPPKEELHSILDFFPSEEIVLILINVI